MTGEMFTEIREIKALGGAAFEMAYGPAVEDGEIVGALVVVRDVTVEHRALTDLTQADELHHMLMSQTSDVIALTTPTDARYTWVSPSAARCSGGSTTSWSGARSTTSSTPRTSTRSAPPVSPCSASASRRA